MAGWDGLLPVWFTRLHARYTTPANSIVFVGVVTLAFAVVGQIGVGKHAIGLAIFAGRTRRP